MKAALGIFLAIMAGGGANAGPDGKEVPRVAFLESQELSEPAMNPFSVINKTVICSRVIVSRAEVIWRNRKITHVRHLL